MCLDLVKTSWPIQDIPMEVGRISGDVRFFAGLGSQALILMWHQWCIFQFVYIFDGNYTTNAF